MIDYLLGARCQIHPVQANTSTSTVRSTRYFHTKRAGTMLNTRMVPARSTPYFRCAGPRMLSHNTSSKVESRKSKVESARSKVRIATDRCCDVALQPSPKSLSLKRCGSWLGLMRRFGGHMNVLDEGVTIFLYTFMHVQYRTSCLVIQSIYHSLHRNRLQTRSTSQVHRHGLGTNPDPGDFVIS